MKTELRFGDATIILVSQHIIFASVKFTLFCHFVAKCCLINSIGRGHKVIPWTRSKLHNNDISNTLT
jgi:hypothetical protein